MTLGEPRVELDKRSLFMAPGDLRKVLFVDTVVMGDDRFREMVARALAQIPVVDILEAVLPNCLFVMVTPNTVEYLSSRLSMERGVVLLGESIVDRPEDEQAQLILPLVARCVARAAHERERPNRDRARALPRDPQTGEWRDDVFAEECRKSKDEQANLQIAVWEGERDAQLLVETWRQKWIEYVQKRVG
jgi:hypothetical protein